MSDSLWQELEYRRRYEEPLLKVNAEQKRRFEESMAASEKAIAKQQAEKAAMEAAITYTPSVSPVSTQPARASKARTSKTVKQGPWYPTDDDRIAQRTFIAFMLYVTVLVFSFQNIHPLFEANQNKWGLGLFVGISIFFMTTFGKFQGFYEVIRLAIKYTVYTVFTFLILTLVSIIIYHML